MAEERPKQGKSTTGRVYKSSDVQVRRVDKKKRAELRKKLEQLPSTIGDEQSGSQDVSEASEPRARKRPTIKLPEIRKAKGSDGADANGADAGRAGAGADGAGVDGASVDGADADSVDAGHVGAGSADGAGVRGAGAGGAGSGAAADDRGGKSEGPGSLGGRVDETARIDGLGDDARGDETPSKDDEAHAEGDEGPGQQPATPDADGEKPSRKAGLKGRPAKRKPLRIVLIVIAIVVFVFLCIVLFFSWNRWGRYDDHADMQGTWYIVGTDASVSIDSKTIQLTEEVAYDYALDQQAKTISYTFGPMSGGGRYWFDGNRRHLVITDGNSFTSTSTAIDDFFKMFSDAFGSIVGADQKLPDGDGVISLSRAPNPFALIQTRAIAQAKDAEEKLAAQEEAKRQEEAERAAEQAANEAAEQYAQANGYSYDYQYGYTYDAGQQAADPGAGGVYAGGYVGDGNAAGGYAAGGYAGGQQGQQQ